MESAVSRGPIVLMGSTEHVGCGLILRMAPYSSWGSQDWRGMALYWNFCSHTPHGCYGIWELCPYTLHQVHGIWELWHHSTHGIYETRGLWPQTHHGVYRICELWCHTSNEIHRTEEICFIVHRESTGFEISATIRLRNLRLVAYMYFAGPESCGIINLEESMGLEDMALYSTENLQDLRFLVS